MADQTSIFTILGSAGGVAKAILSILNKSAEDVNDPIHSYMSNCTIHLLDYNQKEMDYYQQLFPNLKDAFFLHQLDLKESNKLRQHLIRTNTDIVIDVSWADTVEVLQCCNDLGVHYVNSALENTMVDENEDLEGFTLIERYRIFQRNKGRFTDIKAIIGSGMNPGVVQWMATEMIKQIPDETPLGCYIVEHDTSFYADQSRIEKNTIYSTWSPECFLDEALLNVPMFVKQKVPLFLYNHVYEQEFKVALGNKQFNGCLMPHEEVLTLGNLYNMETGFIYRVNEYTTETIRANMENSDDLWNWHHKVLDPADAELIGEDLVGVLLVYKDKERFMYNVKNNKEVFSEYGTNATYFQVASGLYGAISSLLLDHLPLGIYYVDELLLKTESKYGTYIAYYLKDFVVGENHGTDGLMLDRQIKIISKEERLP